MTPDYRVGGLLPSSRIQKRNTPFWVNLLPSPSERNGRHRLSCIWQVLNKAYKTSNLKSISIIPRLTSSHLTSFAPRHNTWRQARRLVPAMLKTSSSCWKPMIRNSRSTIFSKFGSKASLKKLRNLSLSLKERTMTALKSGAGLGLIEAGVKVLEDIGRCSE